MRCHAPLLPFISDCDNLSLLSYSLGQYSKDFFLMFFLLFQTCLFPLMLYLTEDQDHGARAHGLNPLKPWVWSSLSQVWWHICNPRIQTGIEELKVVSWRPSWATGNHVTKWKMNQRTNVYFLCIFFFPFSFSPSLTLPSLFLFICSFFTTILPTPSQDLCSPCWSETHKPTTSAPKYWSTVPSFLFPEFIYYFVFCFLQASSASLLSWS